MIETHDAAWIANAKDGTVTRLDRKTGKLLDTITGRRGPAPARARLRLASG